MEAELIFRAWSESPGISCNEDMLSAGFIKRLQAVGLMNHIKTRAELDTQASNAHKTMQDMNCKSTRDEKCVNELGRTCAQIQPDKLTAESRENRRSEALTCLG